MNGGLIITTQFLEQQLGMLIEKQSNSEIEWQDIADFRCQHLHYPESRDTIRKGYKLLGEYLANGWSLVPPGGEDGIVQQRKTVKINGDHTEVSECEFEVTDDSCLRNPEFLLKSHGYDPRLFDLVSSKSSQWDAGNKRLCASRITVRPKASDILMEDLDAWIRNLPDDVSAPFTEYDESYLDGNKLLIIPISDLHYNLQSTMMTTGNEYNCKIAEEVFFKVIKDIISRTYQYRFNRIIFTIGGDMLNADGPSGMTYKGTPQDNCTHYYDACEQLYAMIVQAIGALSYLAPVDVIYIPGNHDTVSGFKLAKYVEAWFRKSGRITVDSSPKPRKYYKFGRTLFVFAHDGDVKRLPRIVADEGKQYWSDIDTCEVMLQHMHSEQVLVEDHNIRIQRLPTISAKSRWSEEQGYNAKRQCKSFIYDKDKGLTTVLYTNIV